MRNDPTVVALVWRARDGDKSAWDEIVERYAPLVWGICRRHRLSEQDADDVGQGVWLLLVEHLAEIRDPAALPGWLATTTRRECLSVLRGNRQREHVEVRDAEVLVDRHAASVEEDVLAAERNAALRAAFGQLPEPCRRLLSLLAQDPPLSYAEISEKLGKPIGGLGPSRSRCLEKLRSGPALAAFIESAGRSGKGGGGIDEAVVEQ
jgi:RNA polymerase sigma factor (sigma-70 family)